VADGAFFFTLLKQLCYCCAWYDLIPPQLRRAPGIYRKVLVLFLSCTLSVLLSLLMRSQEAVDIVQRSLDRGCHDACQELIETAAARWQEEEGDYRDDVRYCAACVLVSVCCCCRTWYCRLTVHVYGADGVVFNADPLFRLCADYRHCGQVPAAVPPAGVVLVARKAG
jgi:hypothetical protein